MGVGKMSITQLSIFDPDTVRTKLDDLRHHERPMNWVSFAYKNRDSLAFESCGEGGLEELKKNFGPDDVRFAILECIVTDDSYNAVKFVLITWIGANVPPGVTKAKAAGHRKELISFLTESLAIASEYQASNLDELNSRDISAALTKRSATYQDSQSLGQEKNQRQTMSRSHATSGDRKNSQLNIVNEDEVYLASTGSGGLDKLRPELPDNKISFVLMTFQVVEPTNTMTKYVLITWVGENTPPLQKARSGAHRMELAEWVVTIVPFHSHYQANSAEDLNLEGVLFKLRN